MVKLHALLVDSRQRRRSLQEHVVEQQHQHWDLLMRNFVLQREGNNVSHSFSFTLFWTTVTKTEQTGHQGNTAPLVNNQWSVLCSVPQRDYNKSKSILKCRVKCDKLVNWFMQPFFTFFIPTAKTGRRCFPWALTSAKNQNYNRSQFSSQWDCSLVSSSVQI